MTLERGALLNKRYRIVDVLGQGGMAALYRAIDENLGVEVAVKENLFTTEEYALQFRREAVILATLRHPNLPRVTDHFVIHGQGQYLVMDYIEGEDLRQRMDRQGVLTDEEAIILGVAICDALIYLHTRKPCVLHRDVKPGNVKITPLGQVFLVDFGLAKIVKGGMATETGARAMTPGFSPPEQYGTARTDNRSDIYSLGATLYSALSEAMPEDGLARAMGQEQLTSIWKRNPRVSQQLAAVIERALEVHPEDRYQVAEDFQRDLLNCRSISRQKEPLDLTLTPPPPKQTLMEPVVLEEGEEGIARGTPLPPSSPPILMPSGVSQPKRRGLFWFIMLFGLVILTAGFSYLLYPSWPQQFYSMLIPPTAVLPYQVSGTDTPTPLPPTQTQSPTSTVTITIPPTPTYTLVLTKTPTPTLLPSSTQTVTPTPLPTPLGGSGQLAVAHLVDRIPEVFLMNEDGSGLIQLTNFPEGACQPSWSPDGMRLVFISPCKDNKVYYKGSSMFVINIDGSGLQSLPTVPGGDYDPAWSPDGKHIAFTSLRETGLQQIFILSLDDFSVTGLLDRDLKDNSQPAWSPDGSQIAYLGPRAQIWAMNADGTNRFLLSRYSGNYLNADYRNADPEWSPDGQTVAFTQWEEGFSGNPWLASVQVKEGAVTNVIAKGSPMAEPAFSPDGFWLFFTGWPDGVNHHIFLMTANGANRQPITSGVAYFFDPAIRPILPSP